MVATDLTGPPEAGRQFGTFLGVFTPSLLTIIGVIMYLRFGWVVASASLGGALLIVLMCGGVAFITSLSGPILTTATDICGFLLVLSMASAILPRLSGG